MGPGVFNLTGTSIADKFVSRLNADGELIWVRRTTGMDTSYTYAQSIAIDSYGNIFTTGTFRSTVNFDPGTNAYNLTSVGSENMFVDKLGNCLNASSILIQPQNQQACPGTSALFSVTASGAVAYQWQLSTDGGSTYSNITGATGTSYTITTVISSQNNYRYRCQVTGGCNVLQSSAAILTILNTIISVQPQGTSVCAGSNHTFSVQSSGAPTYQWQLSTNGGVTFVDITGATSSSYGLSSVATAQNGDQFRCIITDQCDTITSSVAVLSVPEAASILAQPFNTEICSGGGANFLVSISGDALTTYQWEVSTDGGTNYSPVVNGGVYSGATTSILTITNADVRLNNNRYRCKLSIPCGNANTSNTAILTVRMSPTVELKASPFTSLYPWQTTTLTAASVTTGGVSSFEWYYNNNIIPAAVNSRTVNFDQRGNYQVQINERWPSDLVCSNRSNIVVISANDSARLIIYPNPNNGQFKISYYNPAGVNDLEIVTIYDSKGAMIHRKQFNLTGIYTLIDMKMVPMPGAFYSVVISDLQGNRLAVEKMVVN
jgi:hypothetical protein